MATLAKVGTDSIAGHLQLESAVGRGLQTHGNEPLPKRESTCLGVVLVSFSFEGVISI